uniref:Uncharacterized protein n=1 Tax=Cucumis melo TaxID=3656 RepID=A0A9I9E5E7_CUCME
MNTVNDINSEDFIQVRYLDLANKNCVILFKCNEPNKSWLKLDVSYQRYMEKSQVSFSSSDGICNDVQEIFGSTALSSCISSTMVATSTSLSRTSWVGVTEETIASCWLQNEMVSNGDAGGLPLPPSFLSLGTKKYHSLSPILANPTHNRKKKLTFQPTESINNSKQFKRDCNNTNQANPKDHVGWNLNPGRSVSCAISLLIELRNNSLVK